MGNELQRRIAK
jgi:hypothetical protein